MKEPGIKIQITLSKELADFMENEIKTTFLTKSAWFKKLIVEHMKKKDGDTKRIIDLKIK